MAEVSVVLVHGAFHSFRCWSGLTPILEGAGVDCRAVDLPNTSMADDVAATWRWIDTVGTPVVLLGHSYGGAVICGAGTHPAVQSLIFLTAAVIDSDECLAASRGGDRITPAFAAAMRPTSEDGPLCMDTEAARDVPDAQNGRGLATLVRLPVGNRLIHCDHQAGEMAPA